jgi:Uma2 family endonuclease
MSAIAEPRPRARPPRVEFSHDTLAELVSKLGDVPLERIMLYPPPGYATEQDALELSEAADKRLCEVVENTLVEKAVGANESRLTVDLLVHLKMYLMKHDIGFLTGADGLFRMGKNSRMPDIAFVSWRHFPNKKDDLAKYPVLPFAPDLAVEYLSKSNTKGEINLKRMDYFEAGVKLMWVIDPKTATATVYRADGSTAVLKAHDTLDGEDVLPGLSIPLAEAL